MATNKSLATADSVTTLLKSNSLMVEIGGSIRRITLEKFTKAISQGQMSLLYQVAWGIPILDEVQSSPAWGMVGNLAAYASYKSRVGRYLATADGRFAKLHKNNSAIFADGTALDESKGSVMVLAPRLYILYQVDAETNIPYLWMSEQPISTVYLANCGNGQYVSMGAYKGSITNSKLVSRSDVDFDTSGNNINGYWDAAQAFGSDWGLTDYVCYRWFAIMCLCESGGNANAHASIGQGIGGSSGYDWDTILSSATLRKCGKTKSLGDATGTVAVADANADSCHVSVLGVEDRWNMQYEFHQGVFFGNSDNADQDGTEIFIYTGNRLPSSAELSTHPNGEFRQLTRVTSEGFVSRMLKGSHFDLFAKTLGAGSTSYWCNYYYGNLSGQVLLVGGHAYLGSRSGPFFVHSNHAWSTATSRLGARPAYFGQVRFVEGSNI